MGVAEIIIALELDDVNGILKVKNALVKPIRHPAVEFSVL
jgi:hypothetical protein